MAMVRVAHISPDRVNAELQTGRRPTETSHRETRFIFRGLRSWWQLIGKKTASSLTGVDGWVRTV